MPRNIVIAVLWFLIFVVALVLAIIFGLVIAVVVIPLGVVAIAAHSLIRSVKKRAISAPQAARSTGTALMAGLMSTRADSHSLVKSLPCEHAIRGKGVLQTFKDGSLQFVASEFGSAFNFPFVGIRPEQTSVWHLIGRRFKFFFNEALRRELIQKGGSLFLPWHNLGSAIVGDHDKEKSIIIRPWKLFGPGKAATDSHGVLLSDIRAAKGHVFSGTAIVQSRQNARVEIHVIRGGFCFLAGLLLSSGLNSYRPCPKVFSSQVS